MRIATPNSRTTDPITSHLAGEEITESGKRFSQQEKVYWLVKHHPGHTAEELAEYTELSSLQINRRLPELENVYIHKGKRRECRRKGSQCYTWWPL